MTALRDEPVLPTTPRVALSAEPPTVTTAPVGPAQPARARPAGNPLYQAAEHFLRGFHGARPKAGPLDPRLAKVRAEIAATGTYRHTPAELAYGARLALRESGWCPESIPWRGLLVRDLREVRAAEDVAAECVRHLRMAAAAGAIRPVVSVFAPDSPWRPGPRIRNDQLVRYAGYREPSHVLGDRRYVDFTTGVGKLGWRPPTPRGRFDLLPLVIESGDEGVRLFPIPRDAVLEVRLTHPELPWFAELGLRWHAVPVIANTRLRIGGIDYPAAPYNGVYICRAIGEDVLGEDAAYGLATVVAERLGLDTSRERTLWRDRAALELNRAVLHSFDQAGVSIEHSAEVYLPASDTRDRPAFLR
ncbi:nitric oxide synthase oxygenase [Actinokineospora globicatena]|uniref:nitric oxide synthase oxygenase n=1 Tax=Actinokineospora globicatena TaxID=103729 RepID=UPI0020A27E59|nr:nitric oxide synthase oxygenase [Actinokineospora globicatena]MCP2301314.1 nitric-oxide synthase [Actinokineospora globicatena]GLW77047.1 nitric oxide synthase oxygenase [Actinokineospora globicatena]GLW83881.1 nitric oxide synthase oxygenase [Actinokineospora globicatena]